MQFKFYVLNYNFNRKCVINYNIFNNIRVNELTEKAIKKYLRSPSKYKYEKYDQNTIYGFEALCEEIRSVIAWQQCGRREYEISVSDAFETDIEELEKWDVYKQAEPNIPIIARECIYQYKQQRKENKVNE